MNHNKRVINPIMVGRRGSVAKLSPLDTRDCIRKRVPTNPVMCAI